MAITRADGAVGNTLGTLVAPLSWLGSLTRMGGLFHPDGVVYRADVRPVQQRGALGVLARRLAGAALVRFSGGLRRWPDSADSRDALGIAVRFRGRDDLSPEASAGDQDLIFVTARSLLELPISAFVTNASDFMANEYYAILPFTADDQGVMRWRLVPEAMSPPGEHRRERLSRAVVAGKAVLRLEVHVVDRGEGWASLAEIVLREEVALDQHELRFSRANVGKGILPRGLL